MEAITYQKYSEGFNVEGRYLLDFKYFQRRWFPAPRSPQGSMGRRASVKPGEEVAGCQALPQPGAAPRLPSSRARAPLLCPGREAVRGGAEMLPHPTASPENPGRCLASSSSPQWSAAVCAFQKQLKKNIFLAPQALPEPCRERRGLSPAVDLGWTVRATQET